MKKWIALGGVVLAVAVVAFNWKPLMTGFMTSSIDATSSARVDAISGEFELATRYTPGANGERGNEAPLELAKGIELRTNDKILSGGNDTRLVLALDSKSQVELRAADFILKQLFGDQSERVQINVEEGQILLDVWDRGDREMVFLDTNKNRVELLSGDARCFLGVTSFEGTLNVFVQAGKIRVTNTRKPDAPTVIELGPGDGVEIGDDGGVKKVTESGWIASIAW